jgi:hypothetical protein
MHLNFDSRIEFVDHIINTCDVSKFLDIGGAGSSPNIPIEFRPLGKYISNEIIEQRGLYIAIDNSSENIANLKQRHSFNCVNYDDICHPISLNDQMFSTIYMGLCLQYLDNVNAALQNSIKHLTSGGSIIIEVPNVYYLRDLMMVFRRGQNLLSEDLNNKMLCDHSILLKLCAKHGLEVVSTFYIKGPKCLNLTPYRFSEFIALKAVVA